MPLKIYLLGQFKLTAGDRPIDLPSRPAQSLLAYLALNAGAALRREKLASLLWGDSSEGNARSYLRQALWRIRKSLESSELDWTDYLQTDEISVTFDSRSDYWLDADQLLLPPAGQPVEALIEQVRLHRGELLPGFYEEWVAIERDRIQAAYSQKMDHLLACLAQQRRWEEALAWGEEWIRYEVSSEPACRVMMAAYAALGRRGMVGATFQRCQELLERDLGVEPSPETIQLYEQLLRGAEPGKAAEGDLAAPPGAEPSPQPAFILADAALHQVEKPLVVARERELARLDGAMNLALKGQGQVIFITGEAGSGKTILFSAFASRAQAAYGDLASASGNCNAHTGIGDPYLPFREILALLTGDVEARWSAGAISQNEALFLWNLIPAAAQALMDAGPDLVDTFLSSQALFSRAAAFGNTNADWKARLERFLTRREGDLSVRNSLQSDLFIQYTKVLQILSRKVPLVLFLDDLQWADPGSISLLFHLGRHLSGSRILIVGAFRPEEVSLGRGGERHPLEAVVNELQRAYGDIEINLDQADGRPYIDALLDSEPNRLSRTFREMLYNQTHGHPLFTIELLQGMQDRGDLIQDADGRWAEGASLDWEKMPARVEAVIAERIGRLNPELQATLRAASVEGEVFTAEVVARVHALPDFEVLRQLSSELDRKHRLIRAQSIQRVNGQLLSSYRFRHFLVQRYLYGSLDEIERVHLHEQIGCTLEEMYASQLASGSISPHLARHFEEARNIEKAIPYLYQAGRRAFLVSAYQEAITHLKKGLALIETLPDPSRYVQEQLALLLELTTALHMAKGSVDMEAEKTALLAFDLCEQIGSTRQQCQILGALSIYRYVNGDYKAAKIYAERLLDLSREVDDPLLINMGYWCLGIAAFVTGSFTDSRYYLERVVSTYDPQQHHRPYVLLRGVDVGLSAMAYLACSLWCLGYPGQALQKQEEAVRLAKEVDHAFTLLDVLRYGECELHAQRRDGVSLKVNAEVMARLAQENEFPAWLAAGRYSLGEAHVLLGRTEEGISMIKESVGYDLANGVYLSIPGALCFLVEAYVRLGELDEGLRSWNQVIQMIERTGERHWEAELYRMLAMLELAQGDEAGAETSLKQAIEIARSQQAKSWELRAALDLAKLWQRQGRGEEGRRLVQDIYAWFTEGFDTPDLQAARQLCEGG